MKHLYLYISMLFCTFAALAQNQNNHWKLGPSDVNFSTNPGTVTTTAGLTNYGMSAISDANGNLLFYTDGLKVWNKNNQLMPNGNIAYDYSVTVKDVIILPHPGYSNKYFIVANMNIFTGGIDNHPLSVYFYAMVDFANNSLGEVVVINSTGTDASETPYTVFLRDNDNYVLKHYWQYSPLNVVKKVSGDGYWVVVQNRDNMLSYNLDQDGFHNSPITSTFQEGQIYNYDDLDPQGGGETWGIKQSKIRIVPDYNNAGNMKLYGLENPKVNTVSYYYSHRFYSLNFNNSTGVFSGYQSITIGGATDGAANDFEISNDNAKAYFVMTKAVNQSIPGTTVDGEIRLYNFATGQQRTLYEFVNNTVISSGFHSIQKDRYGNLLVTGKTATGNRNKYLHKINNPDNYTTASVITNSISLNGNTATYLPLLIPLVEQGCIGNISLTGVETETNYSYMSFGTITATNYTVLNGRTINLFAQSEIYLNPNTDIAYGSEFDAAIRPCPAARVAISNKEDNIEEQTIEYKTSLKLYPNPANDITTVSISEGIMSSIEVSSIEGFTVFKGTVNKESLDLNVENYRRGIYIITIQDTEGNIYTEKLMKK